MQVANCRASVNYTKQFHKQFSRNLTNNSEKDHRVRLALTALTAVQQLTICIVIQKWIHNLVKEELTWPIVFSGVPKF